jgi:subtilisin family serine protease
MITRIFLVVSSLVIFLSTNVLSDQPKYRSDRILVKFSGELPKLKMSKKNKELMLNALGGGAVQEEFDLVPGLSLMKLPPGLSVEDAVKKLSKVSGVIYAQPDYQVDISTTPNDTRFSEMWPMNNTGQSGGTVGADIEATKAWDIATGSKNEIIVAVIDTGVDYTHPELAANMWVNTAEKNGKAGVDDDGNGYVDDIYGYDFCNKDGDPKDDHFHGTHCSGTIGAIGNNNSGVVGVCWKVKIMALKFLSGSGSGYISDAIKCVQYSVLMGANLSSNSWGGGGYDSAMRDAINAAGAAGMLFVAAAGNSAGNNDTTPSYPATYDCASIISVLSTDRYDAKSSFSCYGATTVDIGAPGSSILSTFPTYVTSAMSSGGFSANYGTISGTSMATPHVSGACALLWSQNPMLTNAEVKKILMDNVDKLSSLSGKCVSGGRLNIYKAIQQVPTGSYITLDKSKYSGQDEIQIQLYDEDLAGQLTQVMSVTTDGGDSETVTLDASDENNLTGMFTGTISTDTGSLSVEDGVLQVADGTVVTVLYNDLADEDGNPQTVEETADIDCVSPTVTDVSSDVTLCTISINVVADENSTVNVYCTKNTCDYDNYDIVASDDSLSTSHQIDITSGFEYDSDYYYVVEVIDEVGNAAIFDNNGDCYSFHTENFALTGSGTALDPYQINTAEELNLVGLAPCKLDKYFKLMANIDMAGITNYNVIGKFTANQPFSGVFDGNLKTISNLSITTADTNGAGLFGYVNGSAQIKNLGIVNANISGQYYTGALVGYNDYYGKITNCYSTGTVNGYKYTGGLVGVNYVGSLSNCYSTAKVTSTGSLGQSTGGLVGWDVLGTYTTCYAKGAVSGQMYVGGLIGYGYYDWVTNCYAQGSVTGTGDCVGGLVGYSYLSEIKTSYSTGAVKGSAYFTGGLLGRDIYGLISKSYSKSNVTGYNYAGGLIGCDLYGQVSNCYANGYVTIPSGGMVAGGLIGYDLNSSASNCYATGAVSGQYYIGGLVAYQYASNIYYCYSSGRVSGKAKYVGGLVGSKASGSCINSYWNTQTSLQKASFGGAGKTTASMKIKSTYSKWNFSTVWLYKTNNFPTLR